MHRNLVAAVAIGVSMLTLAGCGSPSDHPPESLLLSVEIVGFDKSLTRVATSDQLLATFEPSSRAATPPKALDDLDFSAVAIEPTSDQDLLDSCSDAPQIRGTFRRLRGCGAFSSTDLEGVEEAIRVRVVGPSGTCNGVLYLGDRKRMLNFGTINHPWALQLDLRICDTPSDG